MTAEFENHGHYKQIIAINFDNPEQYKHFVKDIADCVTSELNLDDDICEDIAYELVQPKHLPDLAEAILDRLLDKKLKGASNHANC